MTFLNTWYLAPAIVFGCGGNILNLMVLLHKTMRSRTNMVSYVSIIPACTKRIGIIPRTAVKRDLYRLFSDLRSDGSFRPGFSPSQLD